MRGWWASFLLWIKRKKCWCCSCPEVDVILSSSADLLGLFGSFWFRTGNHLKPRSGWQQCNSGATFAPNKRCDHRTRSASQWEAAPRTVVVWTVLHRTLWWCVLCPALNRTALNRTGLYCTALHCIALYCVLLHRSAVYLTVPDNRGNRFSRNSHCIDPSAAICTVTQFTSENLKAMQNSPR